MIHPKHIEQALGELRTVRDCLRWSLSAFTRAGLHYGHGTDNGADEARWLVLGALGLPFDSAEWVLDSRLTTPERERIAGLLVRRIVERVPTAYLLGEAFFAGLKFKVDERVLIPRSPIAELIESGFEPWIADAQPERILDLCCGGGCIGIAAALHFPQAQVDLADISEDALAVARENIALHGVGERVRAIASDVFAGLRGERYDLILCNPPYVDAPDMAALPAEFHHEPRFALASGEDGLDLSRRILAAARAHLAADGWLVLEVGNSAAALEEAFPLLPFLWPDFARGGHGVAFVAARDLPA